MDILLVAVINDIYKVILDDIEIDDNDDNAVVLMIVIPMRILSCTIIVLVVLKMILID